MVERHRPPAPHHVWRNVTADHARSQPTKHLVCQRCGRWRAEHRRAFR